MRTLKATCTAAILALALSVPAQAGDIYTPGKTPPPPPPPTSNMTADMSESMANSTDSGDTITISFADLLWVLASIL
jgi:hypothetical protein